MFRSARLAAVLLAGLLCVAGQATAKGFNNLSFMTDYNTRHQTTIKVFLPFLEAAKKQFPGKLSFNYFGALELFPDAEAWAAVSDGRADFGSVRPSAYPGKMNLLSVVAIPGVCPNATIGSLVTQDLINKFPEVRAELPPKTVPFVGWASAAYQIHSIPEIKSVADIKGKKIIVWDSTTLEYAKLLGAVPIRMPNPDTYMALSKGMADGVLCPLAPVRSLKVTELAKNHLILDLYVNSFVVNANKELIESMPKDMQDWIKAQGGIEMAKACGVSLDDAALADTEWMKAQGHKFFTLTSEERADMLKSFTSVTERWKNVECKSLNAEVVTRVYQYALERSKHHQKLMDEGAYGEQFRK